MQRDSTSEKIFLERLAITQNYRIVAYIFLYFVDCLRSLATDMATHWVACAIHTILKELLVSKDANDHKHSWVQEVTEWSKL